MTSDSYDEQLNDMIQLFQDYKSGSVKLDNITKLCQTLGLESFIDDINSEISRLSTASKIIVIDIDFDRNKGKVADVKLVLASNFDNFNYFIDQPESAATSNNIVLNSLALYPDLHEFHHNLKYLYLLDTYSNIDIDTSNTTNNGSTNGNTSGAINNDNGNNNGYSGKLDLFKYYTELAHFIKHYFTANSAPFKVQTNLNNRFGIYISTVNGDKPLAKIYLEKADDPQQRLYEFIFSESNGDWVNESAENYTYGVSLVLELLEDNLFSWFPRDFIPDDLIKGGGAGCDAISGKDTDPFNLNEVLQGSKYKPDCNNKFDVTNDFTAELVRIRKFNVGNDNLGLILEILNWVQWSQTVLIKIFSLLIGSDEMSAASCDNASPESQLSSGAPRARRSSASRRRRFSNKNRRPSLTEAAMLKDEGIQQFTLNEIMTEPSSVVDANLSEQAAESSVPLSALANDVKMDLDEAIGDDEDILRLVVSEDHVSLGDIARCTLYESRDKWDQFIEALQKHVV